MILNIISLKDALNDIFYLSMYGKFDASYIENLYVFEKEYYLWQTLKDLKEKQLAQEEALNGR